MCESFQVVQHYWILLFGTLLLMMNNVQNATIHHHKNLPKMITIPNNEIMKSMEKPINEIQVSSLNSNPSTSVSQPDTIAIAEVRSSNDFFPEHSLTFGPMAKMNPNFENIPSQFIGPNYSFGGGNSNPSIIGSGIGVDSNLASQNLDTMNDMLSNTFKKYDVKKYLLKKILGNSHDLEEDEGGFFSNKHLKRHGTAGVAAKVIGELIGIKIRESIEGMGKSFSEYAKDFTARNFVNLGQLFGKVFKFQ